MNAIRRFIPVFRRKVFRLGWFSAFNATDGLPYFVAFRQALSDLGWVEGKDFVIEERWREHGEKALRRNERINARLNRIAADLARTKPDVVVTQGAFALGPMLAARPDTPIAFAFTGDVVEAGFVGSLAHPERNCTGVTLMAPEYCGRQIELLKAAMPGLRRLAMIVNPDHPGNQAQLRASETAMRAIGIALEYFQARNGAELEQSLAALRESGSQAIMTLPDALSFYYRGRIAHHAITHRLPLVSGWSAFADSGFLMTYGPDLHRAYCRLAVYVDRLLKGAKPADLAVELPATAEFVVNLRTAATIGLQIPPSILQRADRIIE